MSAETTGRRRLDYVPLADVLRAPKNPKLHDERGINSSLQEFGYVEPIVMDERTGRLVAGHGRLEQLQALRARAGKSGRAKGGPPGGIVVEDGTWLVPVVRGWSSTDDAQAEAYLLASNRLSERGGWDDAALAELLLGLEDASPGLPRLAGFADADIAELLERLAGTETAPSTASAVLVPGQVGAPPGEPLSAVGEVLHLGPHRLAVGSAADAAVVAAAMDGAHAAVLWTDPPYGVDYVGKTAEALTITNDDAVGAVALWRDTLTAIEAAGALQVGAAFFVAHPDGDLSVDFRGPLREGPWHYQQTLIWVKNTMVLGRSDFQPRHEPIAYGRYGSRTNRGRAAGNKVRQGGWYGGNTLTSVFEVARPSVSKYHPTTKPLALITAHLQATARRGQHVLDCFGGSGSTLLAAHSLGLVAHLVELDPRYADVIASRFQTLTGTVPLVDGRPRSYPRLEAEPALADAGELGEAP